MPRQITPRTTLENLKREAKRWLKALHANAASGARPSPARIFPTHPPVRPYATFSTRWPWSTGSPDGPRSRLKVGTRQLRRYDRVAEALVAAYRTGERERDADRLGLLRPHARLGRHAAVRAPRSRQDRGAAEL